MRVIASGQSPKVIQIGEVMTRAVTTISPDRTVLHAVHEMHENSFRHVPVVQHGTPIGIISIRDALGDELIAFKREFAAK